MALKRFIRSSESDKNKRKFVDFASMVAKPIGITITEDWKRNLTSYGIIPMPCSWSRKSAKWSLGAHDQLQGDFMKKWVSDLSAKSFRHSHWCRAFRPGSSVMLLESFGRAGSLVSDCQEGRAGSRSFSAMPATPIPTTRAEEIAEYKVAYMLHAYNCISPKKITSGLCIQNWY